MDKNTKSKTIEELKFNYFRLQSYLNEKSLDEDKNLQIEQLKKRIADKLYELTKDNPDADQEARAIIVQTKKTHIEKLESMSNKAMLNVEKDLKQLSQIIEKLEK